MKTINIPYAGKIALALINAFKLEKGAASGLCPLDASSKVDSTYLPSYVDDVIEVANYAALPETGEAGKIYITIDTGNTYRWSGSAYVNITNPHAKQHSLQSADDHTSTATAGKILKADANKLPADSIMTELDGKIGIGTTPDERLHISGAVAQYLRIANTADTLAIIGGMKFTIAGSETARIEAERTVSSGRGSVLKFFTGNSTAIAERIRIDDVGNVGMGTATPVSLTELQGGLTTEGAVLTLSTKETTVVVNDVLGAINFRAPLEASGSDAVLTGAAIAAVAEDTFSATVNKTALQFKTGASEAATTKMTLSSAGNLGVTGKVTAAASILTYGLQLEKNIVLATLSKEDGGTPAPTTTITVPNTFEGDPAFSGKMTLLMFGVVGTSGLSRYDRYEVTWLGDYITSTNISDPTQTAGVGLAFTKSGATITVSMTSSSSPGNTITAVVRGQFTELSNFNLSS